MNSTFDVVTFGETMVLCAPAERGPLEYASAYHASIGGAESNSAVGLTRLGHSVSWVVGSAVTLLDRAFSRPCGERVSTLVGLSSPMVNQQALCSRSRAG